MDIREWEEKYYGTIGSKERKELLDERIASEEPSEELELIRELYDVRYKPGDKEPKGVDHMLRAMLTLKLTTYKKGLFSRYPKKIVQGIFSDLGKETVERYGELGRRIWYRELNHLGKTFLSINMGDRGYTSVFWGIGQLKDVTVKVKLAKDISIIAYQTPKALEITSELEVLTAALTAAFNEMFPQDTEILQNAIRE